MEERTKNVTVLQTDTIHHDASVTTLNSIVYLWIKLNGAFAFIANHIKFENTNKLATSLCH